MSELMDLRELAAYLRLDRQTLYNWLHQRKLSGIKMGGVWRFDRQAIDRWLRQQTIQAAPLVSADRRRRGRMPTEDRPTSRLAARRRARTTDPHQAVQTDPLLTAALPATMPPMHTTEPSP